MRKVLLATTMLVAGASVAAAEVTLSGDARMGIRSNFDDPATAYDEGRILFTSRARVTFNLSGESDSGLSYGASFRADNSADAANGEAGSVFISGAFGKLSMGDVDGAAQSATGNVSGVGLTGLGDLSDSTFIGAGNNDNGTADPTVLYEYNAGAFTAYASVTNNDALVVTTVAPPANFVADIQAVAIGGKYTFGDYTVGVGYEKISGFTQAPGAWVAGTPDNVDVEHIVLKVSGTVAGLNVQGLIGQADGDISGAIVPGGAPGTNVLNNATQYAASVSYTSGAITGTAFYTDDSALLGDTAYGVGAAYDLGGGATVKGGLVKNVDTKQSSFDFGVALSF